MTRINLVPVKELTDQHLFAEFREIKMVPKSLGRSIKAATARVRVDVLKETRTDLPLHLPTAGKEDLLRRIPKEFTLGKGHISFFYDKGAYLHERYWKLKAELRVRGVRFNEQSVFDPDGVMECNEFWNNWTPTPEALLIIRTRIAEKIAMKPSWYRYEGKPLENSFAVR